MSLVQSAGQRFKAPMGLRSGFTSRPSFALFGDDPRAEHDALVADVDAGTRDQFLDVDLCLAAE